MVEQFCSECGKLLAEHEGLRCDSCIAIERESLETFLNCLPGLTEKQKVIDEFREELEKEIEDYWDFDIPAQWKTKQVRQILNAVSNIIRTHRKE